MLGLLTVAAASCFCAIESKYALLARQAKIDFCDSRTAATGPEADWQLQAADLQRADIRVGADIVVT